MITLASFLVLTFFISVQGNDIPTCAKLGTDQEGWYWQDSGELIQLSKCSLAGPPFCTNKGSKHEGWFTDEGHGVPTLIQWAQCESGIGEICVVNEDCFPIVGSYCKKPDGKCSLQGNCTSPPTDCSKFPTKLVCGCDGANYTNPCDAAMHGVSVDLYEPCEAVNSCESNGDCGSGMYCSKPETMCANEGLCLPVPTLCTLQIEPVCGCDNVNYMNPCTAYSNSTNVQHHGLCSIKDYCSMDSDCTTTGQFCMKTQGACNTLSTVGECTDMPNMCYLLYLPVCGCDGNTYSNACMAYKNGVNVNSMGEC